ncbi:DUF2330 domain-containing protein [Patescibacteria group bacterium]|nr:DUF2330 domain-containing protein [Patescibacteria group bacterium]
MKKQHFYFLIISLILLIPAFIFADGGMVYWPPDIHLDQSAQHAIVAWNGEEEIIILSNDVKSDAEAIALRIIPLPSNPSEIKEGSFDSFEKLVEIMNKKLNIIREEFRALGKGAEAPAAGVEITFHEKIGAHDITIVKVNDLDCFLDWIKDFATEKGLEVKEISSEFKEGIKNYLKRDIKYFVFDVIDTKEEEESINPLIYRFNSDSLYYPLKITAISEIGSSLGRINIFLIAKEFVGEEFRYLYPVELTKEELGEVNEELASLFESNVKAVKFDYSGRLTEFDKDFTLFPSDLWERNLSSGNSGKDVKTLQKVLINMELWESEVEATGFFGPITQEALIKFQEENDYYILRPLGLEKGTGYFGEKTREFLEKLSVKTEKEIIAKWTRNLFSGTEGDDVKALQEILIKEGVWSRPDIEATGYLGPITKEAVIKFQEKYSEEILKPFGLKEGTGFVGPSTRAYLEKFSESF